jgi:hypothetical protein
MGLKQLYDKNGHVNYRVVMANLALNNKPVKKHGTKIANR